VSPRPTCVIARARRMSRPDTQQQRLSHMDMRACSTILWLCMCAPHPRPRAMAIDPRALSLACFACLPSHSTLQRRLESTSKETTSGANSLSGSEGLGHEGDASRARMALKRVHVHREAAHMPHGGCATPRLHRARGWHYTKPLGFTVGLECRGRWARQRYEYSKRGAPEREVLFNTPCVLWRAPRHRAPAGGALARPRALNVVITAHHPDAHGLDFLAGGDTSPGTAPTGGGCR